MQVPRLIQCQRSQHSEFLPCWASCESCAGIGRQGWFRWYHCLNKRAAATSLERQVELDNTFRLLVEVKPIGRNLGMGSCLIKVAFDHFKEVWLAICRLAGEEPAGEQHSG